jgi:hypothetical protein
MKGRTGEKEAAEKKKGAKGKAAEPTPAPAPQPVIETPAAVAPVPEVVAPVEKELIRVNYVDPEPEEEILITKLNDISGCFDEIFGKTKTLCSICGKEFIKRANNQKICQGCSVVVRREKQKNITIKT